MERALKKCGHCGTYSSDSSDQCDYCGQYFYRRRRSLLALADIFRAKEISAEETVYPYEKNRQLCSKIDQEIQRVTDIQNYLANIRNEKVKEKIDSIVSQINGYIDSLVKCRCDIEFIKISGSLNALMVDSGKIRSEDIVSTSGDFKEELLTVFEEIRKTYNREYLEPYFAAKKADFEKVIENMSVLLISSILSKTSIVKELEYGPESSYKNLEENIDNINYEIDRLSAELSM